MGTQLLTSPPEGYIEWLKCIKERIRTAQQRAVLAANSEMLAMYWQIGRDILERQEQQGWGSKVVDRLSADLRREFPEMKGFSARNLKYMRLFAETWIDGQFVQRVVAQIPWAKKTGQIYFHLLFDSILTLLIPFEAHSRRILCRQSVCSMGF